MLYIKFYWNSEIKLCLPIFRRRSAESLINIFSSTFCLKTNIEKNLIEMKKKNQKYRFCLHIQNFHFHFYYIKSTNKNWCDFEQMWQLLDRSKAIIIIIRSKFYFLQRIYSISVNFYLILCCKHQTNVTYLIFICSCRLFYYRSPNFCWVFSAEMKLLSPS